ncbi:glycoside hydrolase family 1 protein [Granulicella arctica]|uniref:beta-glucosidase n=1 Tax=Granulicella arctica TaxID=940613 RepID=UPI0021DFA695|nr:beta-glucosidase [Granulicella arctica]
MGGFECATHQRRDRTRLDVLATTGHDQRCAEDYALLAEAGVTTVRDGLRWHLIERVPYVYDWASFLPMLHAAQQTGTQVIWDLCHWGVPEGLDPFSDEFPERFALYAAAAATLVREENMRAEITSPPIYCAINEISFWSWVGGDVEHFHPYGEGRGPELKRQLVRASVAAIQAVRAVDSRARFVQAEPIIQVSEDVEEPEAIANAEKHTASQFEGWDMLAGLRDPELGGGDDTLDMIGVNYYWNNQWVHEGDRTPPGHPLHRPLHRMLAELWERYRRPILITETGAETGPDVGWLGYVSAEVRQAQRMGVPILGICLYPVMDYPGWDDERHCECGLIEVDEDWSTRSLRTELCEELRAQQQITPATMHGKAG